MIGSHTQQILEWVSMPSFRGSSRPRVQTCISCIGKQVLYHWETRQAPKEYLHNHSIFGETLVTRNNGYLCCLTNTWWAIHLFRVQFKVLILSLPLPQIKETLTLLFSYTLYALLLYKLFFRTLNHSLAL